MDKKRFIERITIYLIFMLIPAFSQSIGVPSGYALGVGTKGLIHGANYTALANDFSSLYFNPAGLGFLSSKKELKFSANLAGLISKYKIEKSGNPDEDKDEDKNYSLLLNSLGFTRSFSVKRGGMAYAVGYYSPYVFYDNYLLNTNISKNYVKYSGALRYWSGGLGLQVAKGLSAGVSAAFVSGDCNMKFLSVYNSYKENYSVSHNYFGYDLRGGIMYKLENIASFGLSLVVPQILGFTENYSYYDDSSSYADNFSGILKSSYYLNFGAAFTPDNWLFNFDVNVHAPLPEAEDSLSFAYWHTALGFSMQIPVFKNVLLMIGYKWGDLEKTPYYIDYNIKDGYDPNTDVKHKSLNPSYEEFFQNIGGGFSFLLNEKVSLNLGYMLKIWELEYPFDGIKVNEKHYVHALQIGIN